jgi:hypothetical protein
MTERERTAKWMVENGVESIRAYQPEEVVTIAMCYASDRVREELEAAARAVCWQSDNCHERGEHTVACDTIRRRIAELEPSKLEAER